MNIIDLNILNIIIITFPIILNTIVIAYKKIINDKEKELLMDIALAASLYFLIRVNIISNIQGQIIVCLIPLLLSFLYKKKAIIFIIVFILYDLLNSMINPILLITLFLSYFILYYYYLKTTITKRKFFMIFYFITGLFLIINSFIFKYAFNLYNVILILILSYIIIEIVYFLINKSEEVLSTYLTFKELEKEKTLRLSLYKMTHEIKNPISVIKGFLDMFDFDNKRSIRYIEIMKTEVNRTLGILNDFSQLKNIKIDKELMDTSLLMEELKFLTIPFFKKNHIKYQYCYEEEIVFEADYNKLKQVLINTIKNSLEALRNINNGNILIKNYISNDYVIFSIIDNGIGMDKETLDNIFTPFFTTKSDGTGLGLVLSKEIIEAHNGKINIKSIINKGTTINIILPLN
ncbi:MAG: HAMP domain-containing sensor histidine kinase [Bacilli bacterium]